MSYVFSKGSTHLGNTSEIAHEIRLTDDIPVRDPYRRVPPAQLDEFRVAVQDLLEAGVIRESKSPYASTVVLVRKKDGRLRVCVDFRKINAKTVIDAYPIPRIAETLEALHGAKWFCFLDLQSGYLQVGVREADKPKTATTTPFGLYEFNRMPFGLTNEPAMFQRLMERCLAGLNLKICLVYLDDIIVFGSTFEETLRQLRIVLKRLGDFGLKLKASKCKLFHTELSYLGHIVYALGVSPDPDKIKALQCKSGFSTHPRMLQSSRHFLALLGIVVHLWRGLHRLLSPFTSWLPSSQRNNLQRNDSSSGRPLVRQPSKLS